MLLLLVLAKKKMCWRKSFSWKRFTIACLCSRQLDFGVKGILTLNFYNIDVVE